MQTTNKNQKTNKKRIRKGVRKWTRITARTGHTRMLTDLPSIDDGEQGLGICCPTPRRGCGPRRHDHHRYMPSEVKEEEKGEEVRK